MHFVRLSQVKTHSFYLKKRLYQKQLDWYSLEPTESDMHYCSRAWSCPTMQLVGNNQKCCPSNACLPN